MISVTEYEMVLAWRTFISQGDQLEYTERLDRHSSEIFVHFPVWIILGQCYTSMEKLFFKGMYSRVVFAEVLSLPFHYSGQFRRQGDYPRQHLLSLKGSLIVRLEITFSTGTSFKVKKGQVEGTFLKMHIKEHVTATLPLESWIPITARRKAMCAYFFSL